MSIEVINYILGSSGIIQQYITSKITSFEIIPLEGRPDSRINQVPHLGIARKVFVDSTNCILPVIFCLYGFFGMQHLTYSRLITEYFTCGTFGQDQFIRIIQTVYISFQYWKIEDTSNSGITGIYRFTITDLFPILYN